MTTRTEKLLQFLEKNSRCADFRSTPYLSSNFGIRNLPDAIKKLRAKGHDIRTTRADVVFSYNLYHNVGIYTYYKPKVKRANQRKNKGPRRGA